MEPTMFPTRHAVQRYQQRVSAVPTHEAFRILQAASATARRRAKPRWWTPIAAAPGLLFLYPSQLPGVCLLCRDGVILTVFERDICRQWTADKTQLNEHRQHAVAYHRPPAGALLREAA